MPEFNFKKWIEQHPAGTEFYVVAVEWVKSAVICYYCTEVDDSDDPERNPLGFGMLQLSCDADAAKSDHGIVMWDPGTQSFYHMMRADVRPHNVMTIDTMTAEQLIALRDL